MNIRSYSFLAHFLCVVFFAVSADAFVVVLSGNTRVRSSTTLNIFGKSFKDAFSNEDLGERQNAGLKGGPKANENVSINGKAVPAVVGQKLSVVAAAARVQIPYNCRNGECGTCTVKVNSRKVKACQATVPVGDCRIETL
mmetsp:Transcript_63015/g.186124  ORF Transcript_63015/g.186124 Transcript_63015/m.186124 type:complete len:140 (-) Transcript_63015:3035-3454(-)